MRGGVLLGYGLLALALLAVAGCGPTLGWQGYLAEHRAQLYQPAQAGAPAIRFQVTPGTPARTIAQELQEVGLIRDARLFEAYLRSQGMDGQLQAGTYLLSPSMTPVEIAEALRNGRIAILTVTIPEGWRIEQIGDYLESTGLLDGDTYRARALHADLAPLDLGQFPFLQARPAGASLEGYLFPDTYELPLEGGNALDLLERQLRNFSARVLPQVEEAQANGTTSLDLHAILTLASIVEREAVLPEERPRIAGVYLNRLDRGMRLEADPTVQYAMGFQPETGQWWKSPVSLEEYAQVDSPYNTYLYPGLPPGPIANPGLGAIQAVLYPEQHDFLYFVAAPDGSGAHRFARTLEEHLENVARYRQGR